MTTDTDTTSNRYITTRGIIVTGWILLLILCIFVVGSTVYLMITGKPVPEILLNWSSTVIGFLLGSFVSLVKEFIKPDA